jgi:NAD(P)-dependent dehydrogenase (short-subunit alcohol dehydrogenase family)
MSAHPLSGLVVAVVGATGELGSRLARGAAARGAHVVLVGRDERRLHGILEGASVVAGDVADTTLGHRVVAAAVGRYGGLDGLVNAAGVVAFGPLLDTDDEVIEELFLTNVLGPLFLLRRVVPALAKRRGFVVQLSAVVAETPLAGMAAYKEQCGTHRGRPRPGARAAALGGRRHRRAAAAHRDRLGRPATERRRAEPA